MIKQKFETFIYITSGEKHSRKNTLLKQTENFFRWILSLYLAIIEISHYKIFKIYFDSIWMWIFLSFIGFFLFQFTQQNKRRTKKMHKFINRLSKMEALRQPNEWCEDNIILEIRKWNKRKAYQRVSPKTDNNNNNKKTL